MLVMYSSNNVVNINVIATGYNKFNIGPEITTMLSTPNDPIPMLINEITIALNLYDNLPFDNFSKNEAPAESNPIEVLKHARAIANPITIEPTFPRTLLDMKSNIFDFVNSPVKVLVL